LRFAPAVLAASGHHHASANQSLEYYTGQQRQSSQCWHVACGLRVCCSVQAML